MHHDENVNIQTIMSYSTKESLERESKRDNKFNLFIDFLLNMKI